MRVVVIGSGFGGLSAAIRLQQQGHAVTIVEQRDKPGGRAYVYEQEGFVFDGGPTIITGTSQVILNVVDQHMSLADAMRAPRLHHQALPDTLRYETGGL